MGPSASFRVSGWEVKLLDNVSSSPGHPNQSHALGRTEGTVAATKSRKSDTLPDYSPA